MATTTSSLPLVKNAPPASFRAQAPKPAPLPRTAALPGRRQWLSSAAATLTLTLKAAQLPARAQDVPLFGLRKKLEKVEEEAGQIVKEGIEKAGKGIKTAEKGIETVEKEIETAEKGIEASVSFGGLAQAAAVAGAELVGVVVATSVVNGILGPEGQES